MVSMQSIHRKKYRHFILIIDETEQQEETKFKAGCGVGNFF